MAKKDRCKEIMGKLFGPASAAQVEMMTETECVDKCKSRVATFLGQQVADKEFAGV